MGEERTEAGIQTERWGAALACWRLADWRPRLVTFLAAGLTTALSAGLTFRAATTPWSVLADYDYWGNITGLITEQGVILNLASLFSHNNEHIVVIPKLIYVANYLLTSGSNIGLIVYSICAGAACAILLLLLAQDLLRDTPARWVWCGLLFPLAMFSAKLSHSYFFGMSGVIWLTADLFVILSAAALAKAARMRSTAWLLASLFAALLGALAYSTAIYSLLVLLVFCGVLLAKAKFRGPISRLALLGIIAVLLGVLAAWLAYRTHPGGHPSLAFDPIGLAGFVLIYIGGPLANGVFMPIMGLVILAAGTLAILRLVAAGRRYDIVLWVTLFLYAPFNAFMTGIGRLGFGIQTAASSRYMNVATISLLAAIVLVLAALPKQDASRRPIWIKAVPLVAFVAMAAFFIINSKTARFYVRRLETKPVAEIAMRQNIAGDQHLAAGTPAIPQIYPSLPALRAAQHVPFNAQTHCEEFIGQVLAPALGDPAGAVETMTAYTVSHESRTAIALDGWAVQGGEPADCIAVVDGIGVVIGAGVTTNRHRDPSSQRSLRIGWQAVAPAPQDLPVCAFALFPNSTVWTRLANCQTEMGRAEKDSVHAGSD